MSATRWPRCRSASAHNAPANPEPTIATSASTDSVIQRAVPGTAGREAAAARAARGSSRAVVAPGVQAVRTGGESIQIPEIGKDARAAAGGVCMSEREAPLEVRRACGWRNQPWSASASSAPFPVRVGMSEIADAPAASATSMERSSQSSCSACGHKRWRDQQEHAERNAERREVRPPRAGTRRRVIRLCRRSSASGCAVSSPIATSSAGAAMSGLRLDSSAARNRLVRAPTSEGCDSTMTRVRPREAGGDIVVVGVGNRTRIEEAAGVVQLHAGDRRTRARLERAAGGVDLRRDRTRAACRCRWCAARGRTSRSATDTRDR